MTFHETVENLKNEIRDIRNDAVGPIEVLSKELRELRTLVKRTYTHFTARCDKLEERIKVMAATLTDLKATLDAQNALITQAVALLKDVNPALVDQLNTNQQAVSKQLQDAITAAQPAPAPTPAP